MSVLRLLGLVGALVALALAVLPGCSRAAPDATPEGAVRQWLEKMEDSLADPAAGKEAYALLSAGARKNLKARADRDGPRQGRRIQPYEMLAEGRFGLRFRPKHMSATITGDRASVDVRGDEPTAQATVFCSKEPVADANGKPTALLAWRVDLELPDVAPLNKRPGTGGSL
ncbi:MAG: hypothetical protein HOO96_23690 [Polyangiaceae bacterium]|nr:hypothetical protein [Polyangiaceae bacterium]